MLSPRLVLACALALGAIPSSALAQDTQRFRTDKVEVIVETLARNLENPWGLAFLPDNRMLVTERPGRLRIVDANGQLSQPIQGVPQVAARGQGGLLDVALDPDFAQNRLVYLSFAEDRGEGRAGTSVARGRLNADATAPSLGPPAVRAATLMRELAHSPAADPSLPNQMEDQNRLAMESGTAAFELNYPFVYPSMKANNPKLFKSFRWAPYPRVDADRLINALP